MAGVETGTPHVIARRADDGAKGLNMSLKILIFGGLLFVGAVLAWVTPAESEPPLDGDENPPPEGPHGGPNRGPRAQKLDTENPSRAARPAAVKARAIHPRIHGQVVESGEVEGLVAINRGSLDGLRPGLPFWVFRGGDEIGGGRVWFALDRFASLRLAWGTAAEGDTASIEIPMQEWAESSSSGEAPSCSRK